jgi:hypothetical protein
MPPAMKSKITESAEEGICEEPQEESKPVNGEAIAILAIAAALVFLIKSRLLIAVILFISLDISLLN